ncbi:MAG: hypothetical protein K6E62_10940 [Lachnospiraceae bacterium]|nr:hypothetical protein [Lachnospiraceae bacterium]
MKISQKHIQYILLLLIVVIGVCAYQFGYVKYIEKANSIKEENKQIEARINELTDKETHREEWSQGIEASEKDIKEILKKYGPGNTPEKSIMFITKLEEIAPMTVSSLAFGGNTPFFISDDTDESGNPKIEMDRTTLTINYNTTYEGLKSCFDYINSYAERMNVNNFNASFNQESGQLSGSMAINLFGVKDEDHVYVAPYTGVVELGTENIFGTIDLTNITTGEENTSEETEESTPTEETSE